MLLSCIFAERPFFNTALLHIHFLLASPNHHERKLFRYFFLLFMSGRALCTSSMNPIVPTYIFEDAKHRWTIMEGPSVSSES